MFHEYCLGVKQCQKKILLALDGFDTHSEDFRLTTRRLAGVNDEEYQFRTDFEIRLFRELMVIVSNIKRKKITLEKQYFFSAVHFCVILPQDRFDQIALDDRDIEKRDICSLNWDAYDLMEMLVKRLEYHFKVDSNRRKFNLENRFYTIIQKELPGIPTEININVNGYPQRVPLFNYLLRHTFWRPRDIIKNFAIIMKLGKESDIETKNPELIQSIIKKALSQGVSRIIEGEFINEYKNVYVNIKDLPIPNTPSIQTIITCHLPFHSSNISFFRSFRNCFNFSRSIWEILFSGVGRSSGIVPPTASIVLRTSRPT